MKHPTISSSIAGLSRRGFIKTGAAAAALPLLGAVPNVFAAGSDRFKIGLVGCGTRGLEAALECLNADPGVYLYALGDIFPDRVEYGLKIYREGHKHPGGEYPPIPADRWDVPPERCFSGFDAYQGVINSGVDLVLLATPPHFRPMHIEAAIKAGVHVFAEKPVAVDPVGCRRVIDVAALAQQKNLGLFAGTHRRHSVPYLETMQRVQDGAIGDLVGGQCYFLFGGLWHLGHPSGWTDMEYQIRNWLYFTWLSGDHIVEQHVHNIDVMNWAFGGPPVKALGIGGRQSRTDPKFGNIWDHFSVEFEYANGARISSMCRQVEKTTRRDGERIVGTRGVAEPLSGRITGANAWEMSGTMEKAGRDGRSLEHIDMMRAIRAGTPLNHGRRIAESTLTAILGRISAYTGREVSYNWLLNASKLDLTPPAYAFGPAPAVEIAVPGTTVLV